MIHEDEKQFYDAIIEAIHFEKPTEEVEELIHQLVILKSKNLYETILEMDDRINKQLDDEITEFHNEREEIRQAYRDAISELSCEECNDNYDEQST